MVMFFILTSSLDRSLPSMHKSRHKVTESLMMEILQMRCLHVEVQEACQATAAVGNVQRQRAARQNAAQGKIPRSEYGTS